MIGNSGEIRELDQVAQDFEAPFLPLVRDILGSCDYYLPLMNEGPLDQPAPSSEPETQILVERRGLTEIDRSAAPPRTSSLPPSSFDTVEGPTLSSPASNSDPRQSTIAGLEVRIETLEMRLASTERELAEIYGAVEHVVNANEKMERALKQQRYGRFLVWGTLILILGVLWATLQSRTGNILPR